MIISAPHIPPFHIDESGLCMNFTNFLNNLPRDHPPWYTVAEPFHMFLACIPVQLNAGLVEKWRCSLLNQLLFKMQASLLKVNSDVPDPIVLIYVR